MHQKRVIVGLSGGVDSAVSAWLLQQEGYDVQGLFMKNWEREDYTIPCTAAQDLNDVRLVCDKLGIVLHTANFAEEYWDNVFTHFLNEYRANRTPNPDILCNKVIKFKAFMEYAKQLGADFIATGHYAGNRYVNGQYYLSAAADHNKDQTYFLYTLGQAQLSTTLFPLSQWTKPKVRELAAQIGLPNYSKKDSVGICFIGKRNFKTFLKRYLNPHPGLIQTFDNVTVGHHEGLMYYTLGQRQGLNIGGKSKFSDEPWYVAAKEAQTNILRVVQGHDHPALYSQGLTCIDVHWVSGTSPTLPLTCYAKTRYRQKAVPGILTKDSSSEDIYQLIFEAPQRAITPGQSVVFYQNDICLGGGTIMEAIPQLAL
jgi:tRNA-specific 2-thiouridylase